MNRVIQSTYHLDTGNTARVEKLPLGDALERVISRVKEQATEEHHRAGQPPELADQRHESFNVALGVHPVSAFTLRERGVPVGVNLTMRQHPDMLVAPEYLLTTGMAAAARIVSERVLERELTGPVVVRLRAEVMKGTENHE